MNLETLLEQLPVPVRVCEVCGTEEQLVPPTLLWFSCPTCYPNDFSRKDKRDE